MDRRDQTTYKPHTSQDRTFTSTAANATAIGSQTTIVRLLADQSCRVNFFGTAVATSMKLAAGVTEYFSIDPSTVISVIRDSADGTLNITEMTQ